MGVGCKQLFKLRKQLFHGFKVIISLAMLAVGVKWRINNVRVNLNKCILLCELGFLSVYARRWWSQFLKSSAYMKSEIGFVCLNLLFLVILTMNRVSPNPQVQVIEVNIHSPCSVWNRPLVTLFKRATSFKQVYSSSQRDDVDVVPNYVHIKHILPEVVRTLTQVLYISTFLRKILYWRISILCYLLKILYFYSTTSVWT